MQKGIASLPIVAALCTRKATYSIKRTYIRVTLCALLCAEALDAARIAADQTLALAVVCTPIAQIDANAIHRPLKDKTRGAIICMIREGMFNAMLTPHTRPYRGSGRAASNVLSTAKSSNADLVTFTSTIPVTEFASVCTPKVINPCHGLAIRFRITTRVINPRETGVFVHTAPLTALTTEVLLSTVAT